MPVPPLSLPPADHVRSPYTGWTRAHWEALADYLLDALVPYATPGWARYHLPGRTSSSGVVSDGLEGFARSFLLASFRIAGARGAVNPALVERYAAGLAAGTDPASGEAWPRLADRSQPMVEAASVAIGLWESRRWLWDLLEDGVRERVVDWLSGFAGRHTWDNNWRLFPVVAEEFLASVGAPYRQRAIDDGLDRVEDWYVGDGWYRDGDGRNFDYYNAWALHLYPLLWSRMAGPGRDGGRGAVYRARLRRLLADYPRFFGADGAPVHQGRSLTYRYAAAAPAWLGELMGCTPLAPGHTRRLASGAVRHFTLRGAPDARGLLPLGWYGTYPPVTQAYSGPASPYWASKAFLGLLLPREHPAWTRTERPLPVEESDFRTALPAPGWLLYGTRRDGIVRLLNHGSDHQPPAPAPRSPEAAGASATDEAAGTRDDPHYAKFGYATATAPETAGHTADGRVDQHVALFAPTAHRGCAPTPDAGRGGAPELGAPSRRSRIHPVRCAAGVAASWHAVPLAGAGSRGARVETVSAPHGAWEIRAHRIDAPAGTVVREGGYAVAADLPPTGETGPGWALARTTDGLTSALVAVLHWDEDAGELVRGAHSNAFGPHSATPTLWLGAHPGGSHVLVSLVGLARGGLDPAALRATARAHVTPHSVRVWLPTGSRELPLGGPGAHAAS
ncbi:DUF2264 domain-containing protein [Streptomyces buecherae]|uniref:DUF2264 domain-containing protein n=1 Tax=Streptomyces buecherae TaxID=2763006 RepID=UPI0033FDFE1E